METDDCPADDGVTMSPETASKLRQSINAEGLAGFRESIGGAKEAALEATAVDSDDDDGASSEGASHFTETEDDESLGSGAAPPLSTTPPSEAPIAEESAPPPSKSKSPKPQQKEGTMSSAMDNLRLSDNNSTRRLIEYFVVVSAKEHTVTETDKGDAADESNAQTPTAGNTAAASEELKDGAPTEQEEATSPSGTSPLSRIISTRFHPQITARYPTTDHEDNPLNNMVMHFCHPNCSYAAAHGTDDIGEDNGMVESGPAAVRENIVPQLEYVMPKIHHFVMTNAVGKKMYGTVLTIWEPYVLETRTRSDSVLDAELEGAVNVSLPPQDAPATVPPVGPGDSPPTTIGIDTERSTKMKKVRNAMGGRRRSLDMGSDRSVMSAGSTASTAASSGASVSTSKSSMKQRMTNLSRKIPKPRTSPGRTRSPFDDEPSKSTSCSEHGAIQEDIVYEDQLGVVGMGPDDGLSEDGSMTPKLLPRVEVTMTHSSDEEDEDGVECSVPRTPRRGTTSPQRCYYLPRCLCILSSWPYLTAYREYLTQLYRLYFSTISMDPTSATNTPKKTAGYALGRGRNFDFDEPDEWIMPAPLERYIVNLCTEIAAPPPGVFEIRTRIFNSTLRFWSPPGNQPVAWVALEFGKLFSCLSVENVLTVWHALAVERQVLLVSSQASLLTVCSEILISLLFPMTWTNLYIPVVPQFLTAMLDAPMPYLCGLSKQNYTPALSRGDVGRETIVVNLDKNHVEMGPDTPPLPLLPPRRRAKLLKVMTMNASHVFRDARGIKPKTPDGGGEGDLSWLTDNSWEKDPQQKLEADKAWKERLSNYDEAFHLAFTPDSPNLLNEGAGPQDGGLQASQSNWDAVQEAFLRFYVSMLKDYRKYLILPNRKGGPQKAVTGQQDNRGFRHANFVANAKSEYEPFLKELCGTQQFDAFLTKRLYDPGVADVTFFDQSIDAKKNRSKLKLKKVETPFLHAASAHKKLKPIIAIEPNDEGLPPNWRMKQQERACSSRNLLDPTPKDGLQKVAHPKWPETLDETLFSTPRPLPPVVEAEFKRQGEIADTLRSKFHQFDKSILADCNSSPEVAAFTVFFTAFAGVIGHELVTLLDKSKGKSSLASLPESAAAPNSNGAGENGEVAAEPSFESAGAAQIEEARTIAEAQLDLAFSVLQVMQARKLHADLDAFKRLIEACGRCGDTTRAMQLVVMVNDEGLSSDNTMYSYLINAFSIQTITGGGAEGGKKGFDNSSIDWKAIKKRTGNKARTRVKHSVQYSTGSDFFVSETDSRCSRNSRHSGSDFDSVASSIHSRASSMSRTSSSIGASTSPGIVEGKGNTFMSELYTAASSLVDIKSSNKHKRTYRSSLVTEPVLKQIQLGESLLEFLYPGLIIDTQSETCPQCSRQVTEDEIVQGWKSRDSQDYCTTCPGCTRRFVARFYVRCSATAFIGSKGLGSALECEFLSPWVLLKELRNLLEGDGIHAMIDPEFRNGADINATLWWNLIVIFMRYRIPVSFLLQGSFQNRLIAPTPDM